MTVNERIQTLLLRRAVERVKLENACLRRVTGAWVRLTRDAVAVVRGSSAFGPHARRGSPATIGPVLQHLALLVQHTVAEVTRCLGDELPDVITAELLELPRALEQLVAQETARALQEAVDDEPTPRILTPFNSVPVQQAAELLSSPLGGAAFQTSFGDLAADTLRGLRNALVNGVVQGLGVPAVARTVQGVLNNRRWQAERIVRSEYVRVGNQAALLLYQQNARLLRGVQWVATLDRRTCMQCAALDGKVWRNPARARMPVTSTHPNCSCTLVPVLGNARELGLPLTPGTRASFSGQVPATLAYPQWFAQQDAAFQREVLGPTRFRLYQQGRVTLRDFTGVHGERSVREVVARARRGE